MASQDRIIRTLVDDTVVSHEFSHMLKGLPSHVVMKFWPSGTRLEKTQLEVFKPGVRKMAREYAPLVGLLRQQWSEKLGFLAHCVETAWCRWGQVDGTLSESGIRWLNRRVLPTVEQIALARDLPLFDAIPVSSRRKLEELEVLATAPEIHDLVVAEELACFDGWLLEAVGLRPPSGLDRATWTDMIRDEDWTSAYHLVLADGSGDHVLAPLVLALAGDLEEATRLVRAGPAPENRSRAEATVSLALEAESALAEGAPDQCLGLLAMSRHPSPTWAAYAGRAWLLAEQPLRAARAFLHRGGGGRGRSLLPVQLAAHALQVAGHEVPQSLTRLLRKGWATDGERQRASRSLEQLLQDNDPGLIVVDVYTGPPPTRRETPKGPSPAGGTVTKEVCSSGGTVGGEAPAAPWGRGVSSELAHRVDVPMSPLVAESDSPDLALEHSPPVKTSAGMERTDASAEPARGAGGAELDAAEGDRIDAIVDGVTSAERQLDDDVEQRISALRAHQARMHELVAAFDTAGIAAVGRAADEEKRELRSILERRLIEFGRSLSTHLEVTGLDEPAHPDGFSAVANSVEAWVAQRREQLAINRRKRVDHLTDLARLLGRTVDLDLSDADLDVIEAELLLEGDIRDLEAALDDDAAWRRSCDTLPSARFEAIVLRALDGGPLAIRVAVRLVTSDAGTSALVSRVLDEVAARHRNPAEGGEELSALMARAAALEGAHPVDIFLRNPHIDPRAWGPLVAGALRGPTGTAPSPEAADWLLEHARAGQDWAVSLLARQVASALEPEARVGTVAGWLDRICDADDGVALLDQVPLVVVLRDALLQVDRIDDAVLLAVCAWKGTNASELLEGLRGAALQVCARLASVDAEEEAGILRDLLRRPEWLLDGPVGAVAFLDLCERAGLDSHVDEARYVFADVFQEGRATFPVLVGEYFLDTVFPESFLQQRDLDSRLLDRARQDLAAFEHDLAVRSCYTSWPRAIDFQRSFHSRLSGWMDRVLVGADAAGEVLAEIGASEPGRLVEMASRELGTAVIHRARNSMIRHLTEQLSRLRTVARLQRQLDDSDLRNFVLSSTHELGGHLEQERDRLAAQIREQVDHVYARILGRSA